MNIQDWFPLGWAGLFSLQSKGLSRVFSSTTIQKYQFFSTQSSLPSYSHIHTWLLKKNIALGFPGDSGGKKSACNTGDPGLIPGSGRSSGEGIGYTLQYSCLENSMDRGAWWSAVHWVTKSLLPRFVIDFPCNLDSSLWVIQPSI